MAQGGGYCSELCGTDADCMSPDAIGTLVCSPYEILPRPDKALSGYTNRCLLQQTCVPCQDDADCGGDYLCANLGGLGMLADFRCIAPCNGPEDCTGVGEICKEPVSETGAPIGKTGCVPLECP
mgnify:CR=1 FL=1